MMGIESTQKICTCIWEVGKKKNEGKRIGTVSSEIARKLRETENLCRKRDSSRLASSGLGTLCCRRMNAIFHGCYEGGSLPETGSEIGELA